MLEEAVSTLKEQVNIYEQEVDQVKRLLKIWFLNKSQTFGHYCSFKISDQRTVQDQGIQLWRRNIHPQNASKINIIFCKQQNHILWGFPPKHEKYVKTQTSRFPKVKSRRWQRILRWLDYRWLLFPLVFDFFVKF